METTSLFLVFIREDGITSENWFAYTLEFSSTPETVWGEKWHICPAGAVPNILPNQDGISTFYHVILPNKLELAQHNTCFSMQDCIDGIIPLGYFDDGATNRTILFPFGLAEDEAETNIGHLQGKISGKETVEESESQTDHLIDNLINQL